MSLPSVKAKSLVEQVCDRLAELIRAQPDASASLPPERRLAEELGVSRSVIREAIKRLELQGLLEVKRGSGIRIVDQLHRPLNGSLELLIPDSEERLRQLHETRLVLEPEAARMAASRATAEHLANLENIQSRLEGATNHADAIAHDLEFHHALVEASGNRIFLLILDSLADISRESRERTIGSVGKETAIEHHGMILEAVMRRDPDGAESAMRYHLGEAQRDLGLS